MSKQKWGKFYKETIEKYWQDIFCDFFIVLNTKLSARILHRVVHGALEGSLLIKFLPYCMELIQIDLNAMIIGSLTIVNCLQIISGDVQGDLKFELLTRKRVDGIATLPCCTVVRTRKARYNFVETEVLSVGK